jgi:lipopolysaccharide assembly protein A
VNRNHVKLILVALVTALVVTFVMQNLAAVEIRFLFWTFALSRALLVLIVLAVGILLGWLLSALVRRHRDPMP